MKILPRLILLLAVCALTACIVSGHKSSDSCWPEVEHSGDSLNDLLEAAIRHDLIIGRLPALTDSMMEVADSTGISQLKARAYYWNAYMAVLDREPELEARYIDSALAYGSAQKYPYDNARIMELKCGLMPSDTTVVSTLSKCLQVYKAAGDSFNIANLYTTIGVRMANDFNAREADSYFRKALKYTSPGTEIHLLRRINIMINLSVLQSIEKCDLVDSIADLADDIAADSMFDTRPVAVRVQVWKAQFDRSGDIALLRKIQHLARNARQAWIKPSSDAWMTEYYVKHRQTDSAAHYVSLLEPVVAEYGNTLNYCEDMAEACRDYYRMMGDSVRSKHYDGLYRQFTSLSWDETRYNVDMANLFKRNEIKMMKIEFGRERQESRLRLWLIALGVFSGAALLAAVSIWMMRRNHRRRHARMQESLQRESRRRIVSDMKAQEKENLLNRVMDDVSRMSTADNERAQRLVNDIRAGISGEDDWTRFATVFSEAHPDFINTLSERYPSLTQGDIRIACYTMMGMETKHISKLMNINPTSVAKNRHRLRTKLGLSRDQSLEAFLRTLVGK